MGPARKAVVMFRSSVPGSLRAFGLALSLVSCCLLWAAPELICARPAPSASGAGTLAAVLQAVPSAVDFGSQNVSSQTAKLITIQNVGAVSVTVSGVTVSGAGFSVPNLAAGFSLQPGQNMTMQIDFRPATVGTVTGEVMLLSNTLASPVIVPVVGTGLKVAAQVATAAKTTAAAATTNSTTASSGTNQAKLSWNASSSSVTGYRVHRGTTKGGPYSSTSSTTTALSYTDTSVTAGSTYYYVVTSINASGVESSYSNEVAATIPSSGGTGSGGGGSVPTSPVTGMALNGNAVLSGTKLRLTSQASNQVGSAWFSTPVNVSAFSNDFTFQFTNTTSGSMGNGLTFVIQNAGTKAVGPSGGGLGYGPDKPSGASSSANTPVAKSVAVKFDLVNNAGEGTNSTGLYKNGASPTTPATTLGGGVSLSSKDVFHVHMVYDGTTLSMNITDTAHTSQTFTTSWAVNIPGTVGGSTAYVGFTGATGSSVANEDILTWNYAATGSSSTGSGGTTSKTPVVYQTAKLAASSSGPTFRTFTYAGFPDGTGTILDATGVGQSVTFTVNVPAAGTYDIKLSYKAANTRGISQLAINGSNQGSTLDEYSAGESYATKDYGTHTFASAGNYTFKFATVGKNAKSGNYSISFDDLTLTPQ